MKMNKGTLDKLPGLMVAFIVTALYYLGVIDGVLALVLLGFSVIFILTSLISFCPLYMPFGINTCTKK